MEKMFAHSNRFVWWRQSLWLQQEVLSIVSVCFLLVRFLLVFTGCLRWAKPNFTLNDWNNWFSTVRLSAPLYCEPPQCTFTTHIHTVTALQSTTCRMVYDAWSSSGKPVQNVDVCYRRFAWCYMVAYNLQNDLIVRQIPSCTQSCITNLGKALAVR